MAGILRAQSCASDARDAVREFHAAVEQPDTALVLFFCSSEYDLDALADEMASAFAGVPVVGCTTAGEIGPVGCRDHSISGTSLPASLFNTASGVLDHLQRFEVAQGQSLVQDLLQRLEVLDPSADADNSFAFLLIDGMSMREEPVTSALQNALGKLPLVGGSAADGVDFGATHVYFDGRFHDDSAVLTLVTTTLPVKIFKTQHFVPTDQRVVVTAADAEHRIVREIDGWPAVEAYARLAQSSVESLDPTHFAASPVVVLIDGTNYVRSIQKANSDGSLTFYCAIEEGVVLRVGRGVDLQENLAEAFADIREAIGPPQLVLACDCILRKLEIVESDLVQGVETTFRANNATGFNTYGEQFHGVHVNQTLTGIAIGFAAAEDTDA
jgi:hypothetical protein